MEGFSFSCIRTKVSHDAYMFASDRIKSMNLWRRESTENKNGSSFLFDTMATEQSNSSYYSTNQESFHGGRVLPRRYFFEDTKIGSTKILSKIGRSKTMQVNDHTSYPSDQRWISGDDSAYHPNVDT